MNTPSPVPGFQTPRMELANSLTHGLGVVLGVAALVVMVVLASLHGTARLIVGAAVFGSSLVLLYCMSTLYHAFRGPRVKAVFHVLDHSAIYILIAGTYTPFCLGNLRGAWGWSIFGVIWGLAAAGVAFKAAFGPRFPLLSTLVYVGMGWLIVLAALPLWRTTPGAGLLWLGAGGLFYTGGVGFYVWKRLPYSHAIWHLCVLGGSACHVVSVTGYVLLRL